MVKGLSGSLLPFTCMFYILVEHCMQFMQSKELAKLKLYLVVAVTYHGESSWEDFVTGIETACRNYTVHWQSR